MIRKSDYHRSQVLLAPGKVSEEPVSSSGRLSLASNSVITKMVVVRSCMDDDVPELPERHENTDFVHLRLTGLHVVQPDLSTPPAIALQHLQPVVHLVVDLVRGDLELLYAGQVGHGAHVRQGPQLVVRDVQVGDGVELGHPVEVPDHVLTEAQTVDLPDLGVETLHVLDLVVVEVDGPQVRQPGQVCDFFDRI